MVLAKQEPIAWHDVPRCIALTKTKKNQHFILFFFRFELKHRKNIKIYAKKKQDVCSNKFGTCTKTFHLE